jgi:hypothetical protein
MDAWRLNFIRLHLVRRMVLCFWSKWKRKKVGGFPIVLELEYIQVLFISRHRVADDQGSMWRLDIISRPVMWGRRGDLPDRYNYESGACFPILGAI